MSAWWKRLAITVIVVPAVALLVTECVMRAAGFGYAPRLLLRQTLFGRAAWVINMKAGARYLGEAFGRGPLFQAVPAEKGSNTVRIVVFGESAVKGEVYSAVAVPAQLEVMVRSALPGCEVQVVNAGMPAINAWAVRDFARECRAIQPDVYVLYTGNNEFIGPYGAGRRGMLAYWPPLIRARMWLASLRLFQLAHRVAERGGPPSTPWEGMAACAQRQTSPDDPTLSLVVRNYEDNMRAIVTEARAHGIEAVVCTLAAQARGWPPFASRTRSATTGAVYATWAAAYDEASNAVQRGAWEEAARWYEEAAVHDDGYAEAAYQHAACLERLGVQQQAAECYVRAKDADALKFRPVSAQHAALRRVAAAAQVPLVDTAGLVEGARWQTHGTQALLYDHVHFTPYGSYLAASNLCAVLLTMPVLRKHAGDSAEVMSYDACMEYLGWTQPDEWDALGKTAQFLEQYPFSAQSDHSQRLARARAELQEAEALVMTAGLAHAIAVCEEMAARWPHSAAVQDKLGQAYAGARRYDAAAQAYQRAINLNGTRVDTWARFGTLLCAAGRPHDALRLLSAAIRNGIALPQTYCNLASAHLAAGDARSARRAAETAIRRDRMSADAWYLRGCARAALHDTAGARADWEHALRLQPFHGPARQALGELQ